MPFTVIRNDITAVTADAIVNTANPRPVIGAGTDRAIYDKAGRALLEARKRIGAIAPGHSEPTPAFGLNAKYVLHTVSPAWVDGKHREAELLRQAYDSALHRAAELGCRSVAFPLMAAGSYRFPKELALSTAIDAFTDFLAKNDMEIILVLFDRGAFELAGGRFAELKSYVDENYVTEQEKKERSPGRRYARDRRHGELPVLRPKAPRPSASRDEQTNASILSLPHAPQARPSAARDEDEDFNYASTPDHFWDSEWDITEDDIFFPPAPTFTEKLREYLMEHEGKDSAVYGDGAMSRQLFNKIINAEDYNPKKSTVIQLAIGLHLDYEQTQELLASAGYVLTRSDKRDVVVEYYIKKKVYKVVEIDLALEQYGLDCLGKY